MKLTQEQADEYAKQLTKKYRSYEEFKNRRSEYKHIPVSNHLLQATKFLNKKAEKECNRTKLKTPKAE